MLIPEGESPLYAGFMPEVLVSRKVVVGNNRTEGSETTKSGTDEQKLNMRHDCMSKQAHHCNAQRTPKVQLCRFSRDWTKEYALTWGGLNNYELVKLRSQPKS